MFEGLNELLSSSSRKAVPEAAVGKALDILRQIEHFQHLNSSFGSDYLALLLQTIHPFILREGFSLISECDNYMLLEGDLREEEPQFDASREVAAGKVLDLNDRKGVRFTARSDCKMLRLKKGLSGGFHIDKKLCNMQKERKRALMEMEKQLGGESYKQRFQFLQKLPYFNSLGEYDFLDLTSKSSVREYTQGNTTHHYGEGVGMIGCVLAGKVRLDFPTDRARTKRRGVGVYLGEGDWIGLQQYLWRHEFGSSGETTSIITMIVWIPIATFECKFNPKTNHSLYNSLTSLIEAKKKILERSLECRRNKELERAGEGSKTIPDQLAEKISCFQFPQERRKSHFRSTKVGKDIQIPEIVMHRMNFTNDFSQPAALPKLEKVNLFPEQYKAIPISSTHLKEMQRLQKIRNHSLPQKRSHSFIDKDPAYLFQTILDKLPPKFKSPPPSERLPREEKASTHYNMSIYNNFRVPRQRPPSPAPTFHTLSLLTNP